MGACVLALGPGHFLHGDTARGTIDSSHGVAEKNSDVPHGNETEQSLRESVVSWAGLAAFRTLGLAIGPGSNIDHQRPKSLFADSRPSDFPVNEGFDRMELVE